MEEKRIPHRIEDTQHHWKKYLNKMYLGAWSLYSGGEYKPLTTKITSFTKEDIFLPKSNKPESKLVANLEEIKEGFILNSTNLQTLAKLFKSDTLGDFVGKYFTIEAVEEYNRLSKRFERVLRVSLKLPEVTQPGVLPTKEKLSPDSPRWAGMVKALEEGKTNIQTVMNRFDVSQEGIDILNAMPLHTYNTNNE
jgi:hypothetical protein